MKKKLRFSLFNKALVEKAVAAALVVSLMPLAVSAGPVDINTADAKTLARELQGIGLARAQAIVSYREKNGPFKTAEDLSKIKSIGAHVIEQNRGNIQLQRGGQPDKAGRKGAKGAEGADAASEE